MTPFNNLEIRRLNCVMRGQCLQLICVGVLAFAIPSLGFASTDSGKSSVASEPSASSVESSLSFRFDPLVDLYLFLRKEVDQGSAPSKEWRPALERMRDAANMLPGPRGLAMMNGIIAGAGTLSKLSQAIEHMPETAAGGIPLRATLSDIAHALRVAKPLYAQRIGPAHRKIVEKALHERIDPVLVPKEEKCLFYILSELEIADPGFEVPVFLVAAAPEPGSITSRSRRFTAASFVSIQPYTGTTLFEVILHEATHALVTSAGTDESVLDRLRSELQAHGIEPSSPLLHSVPHTLVFVQAGQTVQRFLDPAHIPYGVSHGYYAKVPFARIVRKNWIDHLNAETSVDVAINRIVYGVLKTRKNVEEGEIESGHH